MSMIRKYHNHKLQTTPWHREEEPLNHHETGLIFKPDTIIINHQLEFSRTRVKYLDHEKRTYKREIWSYRISEKASNNRSFWRVQRDYRCVKVVWSLLQLAYFDYARCESPDEDMRTRRLVGAFATRRYNKNHHLMC